VVNGKPEIKFYVDNVALNDSPKIYLGQKISLSFKAFLNGESVSVSSYTWKVDQPFTSEFRIIGDDQSKSQIIPGKVINNQPVEFLVYSYDRHNKRKTFNLIYDYDGQRYAQPGEFTFMGPDITNYGYKQQAPTIFKTGSISRFGYEFPIGNIPPGHVGFITAINTSDAEFKFFLAQLISLDFSRGFSDSSVEKAVLLNWLDNGFPYTPGAPLTEIMAPGASIFQKRFFDDTPSCPFQEVATAPEPIWYKSKSKFSVFIFAVPSLPNGYHVPVLRYEWSWRGDSTRKTTGWSEVEGSFFPPRMLDIDSAKEISLESSEACELGFPKWDEKLDAKKGLPWKK
jgi:hypothetical protein